MKITEKEGVRIEVHNAKNVKELEEILKGCGVSSETYSLYKKERPLTQVIEHSFKQLSFTGQMATLHALQEYLFTMVSEELKKC